MGRIHFLFFKCAQWGKTDLERKTWVWFPGALCEMQPILESWDHFFLSPPHLAELLRKWAAPSYANSVFSQEIVAGRGESTATVLGGLVSAPKPTSALVGTVVLGFDSETRASWVLILGHLSLALWPSKSYIISLCFGFLWSRNIIDSPPSLPPFIVGF